MTGAFRRVRAHRGAAVVAMLAITGCASPSPTSPAATQSAEPRFAAGGPDADDYGARDGYPIGGRATFLQVGHLVGSHSHLDGIFEGRLIRRAAAPSPLGRAAEPAVRYEFRGESRTLEDYLANNPTTGLLVARGETIMVERYQYGRTDRDRFTSWSMAKTVTGMLVGIALAEERLRSVDDLAQAYVPELTGTEYGRTSIRHLLQMSSGVNFVEKYTADDDVMRLALSTFVQARQGGPGGVSAVTPFNERGAPSGTRFSYASSETQILGLVLRAAIGRPLTAYLEERIWQPMGAEGDATWLVDRSGQEAAYCCLNAVLRDYARFGLLLAHDGSWRGRQLIPATWVEEATQVPADQAYRRPGLAGPFFGYGYQVWIFPGERRMFALLGVRGQSIFVDPASRLVMVHTAVRKQSATGDSRAESIALWRALVRDLGR